MDMKTFCRQQIDEALKYKWIQSQKAGRDLGEVAVREWVDKYAAQYRKEYEDVFDELVKESAARCKNKLREKLPGVSDELWDYIFREVIKTFTEVWVKDTCCFDKNKKKHLEEI